MASSNLTRKDYELIAATIAESPALPHNETRTALALDFADRLCSTSDSFDPVRFVNACNLPRVIPDVEVADWTHSLKLRVESLQARRRS